MKKNYLSLLYFIAALSGKLCIAATPAAYLSEHFSELSTKYSAKASALRSAGAHDCAALIESEQHEAERMRQLYALDLNTVADVFGMFLTPCITDPCVPAWYGPQGPKPLVSFIDGLQSKTGISMSYTPTPAPVEPAAHATPTLADQINPVLAEVTARLAAVLGFTPASDTDIVAAFNGTLNRLCDMGNSTARLMSDAKERLEALKPQVPSLIKAIMDSAATPSEETSKLAKEVAIARAEVTLLAKVVDAFEKVRTALIATGRMS